MKAEDKIYRAYFESKANRLYYSQLKELTALSHSSLQNTLEKLSVSNILKADKQKSNLFYEMSNKKFFSLKFSEIAMQKFSDLNRGVRIPLGDFLKNLPKDIYTIILFGSASRKMERNGSDIDVLVVAKERYDLEKDVKVANVISTYPISVFQCSVEEFMIGKDHVILQAKKTGFPIKGEQNYYEVILDEY